MTDIVPVEGLAEQAFPDVTFWFPTIVLEGEERSKTVKGKGLSRRR